MKKPTKSIITSSLLAVAFGALSVGSTFALFTSQSKTEVTVESGIVNVESKATLVNYSSSVDGTDHDFGDTETSYSNVKVGNSFSINGENSIVTIDKMVPGDSLTIKLSALNKSNVKTKTRLTVEHSKVGTQKDLFPALDFTFYAGALEPTDLFRWQENAAVAEADMAAGVDLYGDEGILVTIAFPDGDNGQILFGSENHDNQYQNAACSIAFSLQAVQGNAATSPIDEINAYLSAEMLFEGQNKTMHDAVVDMAEIEYTDLAILDGYVYDLANDQFVKENSVTANKVNYFRVYESMPTTQDFSIYAVGNGWTTVEGLIVGFDAGDLNSIVSIEYNRHDATVGQEVTIRTNGGTLTVDAPLDTIHHYGDAQMISLTAVSNNSYYENGSVSLVDVKKGRLVITNEQEASVGTIYLSATNDAYDNIILATQSNAELPNIVARESVSLPTSGEKLVVTIQQVDSTGTADPTQTEEIYLYPESDVKEEEKGYDVSDLGLLVVEALSTEGQAQAEEQLADKGTEVVDAVKVTNVENKEEVISEATAVNGGKGTEAEPYLIATAQQWNSFYQVNYDSQSYPYFKLVNDIDFTGLTINNKIIDENGEEQAYFWLWGDIDGNGHSLLNVSTFRGYNQLLPYIDEINIHDLTINYNIDGSRKSTAATSYLCYTATFENVVITGNISTTADWASAFVAYPYGSDCTLTYKNCTNYANLTSNFTSNSYVAPFGSHTMSIGKIILDNCKNYGTISGGHVSAFVGMTGGNSTRYTVSNLENYGKLVYAIDNGAGLFTYGSHPLNSSVTAGATSTIERLPSVNVSLNEDGKLVIHDANSEFDYAVTMSVSVQLYGYNDNNTWSGAFPRTLSKTYKDISGNYVTDFVSAVVLENAGTRLNYGGEEQAYYGIYAPSDVKNGTVLVEDDYGAISLVTYNDKTFYYYDESNEDGTSYYGLVTSSNGADTGDYKGTITVTLTVEQLLNGVVSGSGKVSYTFNVADAAALFSE